MVEAKGKRCDEWFENATRTEEEHVIIVCGIYCWHVFTENKQHQIHIFNPNDEKTNQQFLRIGLQSVVYFQFVMPEIIIRG